MTFGDRLKQLRNEKNITQSEIANVLNVSRATIAGYETKGKQPDFEKLKRLSTYFNVSIDYLLCNTDIKNPYHSDKKSEKDLNPETAKLLKKISSLSEESKKDLEKQIELLKIRDSMDKAKNETLSTSEEQG